MKSVFRARFDVLTVAVFACGLAYEPLYHIWHGSLAYSLIPQDDFYYYYLTAKHFAATGLSSFDGIVATNGYHPLWMLILAGLSLIANGKDTTTFVLMEVIQIISAVSTAALTVRLFRELYGEDKWVPVIVLLVSLLLTVLIFLSMETVVAIPLYLLFVVLSLRMFEPKRGFASALGCGIAGTFLFLARLDALLAIGVVALLLLYHRAGTKSITGFLIGLLPIEGYFIINKMVFGGWLPVSAQVKAMGGFHLSLLAIEAIRTPRGALYAILTLAGLLSSLRALLRSDIRSGFRAALFVIPILGALVWAAHLSWPVYVWYFYPFPISAGAGLLELERRLPAAFRSFSERVAVLGMLVILAVAAFVLYRDIPGLTSHLDLTESDTRAQPNIYVHALGIQQFTDTHPGRYAMGDRAGLTAFITGQPILQIEGLAADQTLVDSIRARADLLNVLNEYGVHYYIVSYPLDEFHEKDSVWNIYEPHKQEVLPWMPLMHGRFYAPEVFRFPLPLCAKLSAKDSTRWVTRILDISRAWEDTTGTN